eukprot:2131956-Amphidinium_carterae.2
MDGKSGKSCVGVCKGGGIVVKRVLNKGWVNLHHIGSGGCSLFSTCGMTSQGMYWETGNQVIAVTTFNMLWVQESATTGMTSMRKQCKPSGSLHDLLTNGNVGRSGLENAVTAML